MVKEGLFTYAHITVSFPQSNSTSAHWILIAYQPNSLLAAIRAKTARPLVMTFIVLAIVFAVISAVLGFYSVHRQETEARVRESEARFRKLLDSAPDAIVIVDQNGCINLINNQAEKWFGYSREELLGKSIDVLVPEQFRERHLHYRQNYLTNPVARPMAAETELYGLRKDGTEFPVEISLSPLQTGKGLLVTSVIRDITARKHTEHLQRLVQARYKDLVNNLPVGVYRKTPGTDGQFIEINQAMVNIFEAESVQQLLSHPVSDLYCNPADRKKFSDKVLRESSVNGEELHLKTLRGKAFTAANTAVKTTDHAGNIYIDGIVQDISARKEGELRIQQLNNILRARSTALEATNRELEAFSYSVSHDLRAPLRAIDGFSRVLLNDYAERLDERGRDRLSRVRTAAQHMATLIDDLLKLARVSRAELNRQPVNLTELANEVIEDISAGAERRKVNFSVQPDLITNGDVSLLRVVMDNLLGNAWKFTSQCDEATIQVGGKANGSDFIYFVSDNGAGFDMAYASKLFGAFQRLHDTGEFPGTGIGLATVQRVIHKHGGRIWAESAVGRGATFYFSLQ